jgi:Fumarylacetoacetate (FAA) hydrolase family
VPTGLTNCIASDIFLARDIQRGEDFPFAAFNAKNFATTISPWVVTLDALEPYRIKPQLRMEDDVLPYLQDPEDSTYNIPIRMDWKLRETGEIFEATKTNLSNTYWTFKQMVTPSLIIPGTTNMELTSISLPFKRLLAVR